MNDEIELEEEGEEPEVEQAAVAPVATVATPPEQKKEIIVDDPYIWEKCQVTVSLTFLPSDGHEQGRVVILGGRTHDDPPIIKTFRAMDVMDADSLFAQVLTIMEELQASLPGRAVQAAKRKEEKLAKAAASHTPVTRNKPKAVSPSKQTEADKLAKWKASVDNLEWKEPEPKAPPVPVQSPEDKAKKQKQLSLFG